MLAWPQRFDRKFDRDMAFEIGDYGYASQYQQSPVPRKGGILKREYWQDYIVPPSGKFPTMEYVLVSVDTAFTEKEENDPTGCTTWGVWTDPADGFPKVMMLRAWRRHLPIHGIEQEPRARGETEEDYLRRCLPHWGIVEHVAWSASLHGGADAVLVEAKASGLDVINELRRIYKRAPWQVVPINPKTDKYARVVERRGRHLRRRHKARGTVYTELFRANICDSGDLSAGASSRGIHMRGEGVRGQARPMAPMRQYLEILAALVIGIGAA
jgi:hypothetical protein